MEDPYGGPDGTCWLCHRRLRAEGSQYCSVCRDRVEKDLRVFGASPDQQTLEVP